jgi:hypothetical protein
MSPGRPCIPGYDSRAGSLAKERSMRRWVVLAVVIAVPVLLAVANLLLLVIVSGRTLSGPL